MLDQMHGSRRCPMMIGYAPESRGCSDLPILDGLDGAASIVRMTHRSRENGMRVIEALWHFLRSQARPFVRRPRRRSLFLLATIPFVAGCATRPVNPPIAQYDADKAYRIERQSENAEDNATLVILAFSGGGTRAAAFSYGVLETLRDMQVTTRSGRGFACSTRST